MSNSNRVSFCGLAAQLAPSASLLQFPVAFAVNLLLAASQHLLRCDVADGTVQAGVVVMLDVSLHQSPRIFERQWRSGTNALPFE